MLMSLLLYTVIYRYTMRTYGSQSRVQGWGLVSETLGFDAPRLVSLLFVETLFSYSPREVVD